MTSLLSLLFSGLTFSGLLNVLDGVNATNGCVLFFTSAAPPAALDAALVRPGRCDAEVALPRCDGVAAAALFRSFFATHPFHPLSPHALDAGADAFCAALRARRSAAGAGTQSFSHRDVVSFLSTRSPRRAAAEAELLGLDAAQLAARSARAAAPRAGAAM
jgi:SpoVK/Ycf46/Vps4 family AAA+-type ATPase